MKKMNLVIWQGVMLLAWAGCGDFVKDEDEKGDQETSAIEDEQKDEKAKSDKANSCLGENLTKGAWKDISMDGAPAGFPVETQGYKQRGIGAWNEGRVLFFDVGGGSNKVGDQNPTLYSYSPCDDTWATVVANNAAPDWFTDGSSVSYSTAYTGRYFTINGTKYGANNNNTQSSFVLDLATKSWADLDAGEFPGGLPVLGTHNMTRAYAVDPANNFAPIAIERFGTPTEVPTDGRQGVVATIDGGFVVWGGHDSEQTYGDGKVYDLATGLYKDMSNENAPSPRKYVVAAVKGRKVAYWGGYSGLRTDEGILVDGGIYDVDADSWTPIATEGGPTAEFVGAGGPSGIRAMWTGERLMILNTNNCGPIAGYLYDVNSKEWTKMAESTFSTLEQTTCAAILQPYVADSGKVVWTTQAFTKAAIYDPAANSWEEMDIPTHDPALSMLAAIHVWTGNSFVIWGPYKDTTDPTQCDNAPEGVGCDPATSGEYLKAGAIIRITD